MDDPDSTLVSGVAAEYRAFSRAVAGIVRRTARLAGRRAGTGQPAEPAHRSSAQAASACRTRAAAPEPRDALPAIPHQRNHPNVQGTGHFPNAELPVPKGTRIDDKTEDGQCEAGESPAQRPAGICVFQRGRKAGIRPHPRDRADHAFIARRHGGRRQSGYDLPAEQPVSDDR